MSDRGTSVLERLPLGRDRPLLAYGGALAICALASAIRLVVEPIVPFGYPFVAFFSPVMLCAFLFGVRPGILAATICGLVAWYCFLPPVFSVKISGPIVFALVYYALAVGFSIALIHMLQRVNARLVVERERNGRLAARGELLFRELQHRVSNNLQVMSGLLQLQMRDLSDEGARLALDEAARRLGLIGRIHRQLYSPHGEQLHLSAFLEQLGADLIDASGKPDVELRVEADEDVDLPPEAAVPMALIVAEAVTNAIEHGFAGQDRGLILIRVSRSPTGMLDLDVIDDGAGLPPDYEQAAADSLGLKLAKMLAEQLGGDFSLSGGAHTMARLRWPYPRER